MIEEFKKLAECPVCFGRLIPPIDTCHNGHGVCQKCRGKMGQCPTCRSNFSNHNNTLLNQMLELIPIPCRYKELGCKIETLIGKVKEHEKNCNFRKEKCCICSHAFAYLQLNDHFTLHVNIVRPFLGSNNELLLLQYFKYWGFSIIIGGLDYIHYTTINRTHHFTAYAIIHINEINTNFIQRYVLNWESKTIIFSLECLSIEENTNNYFYQITIDQRFPALGKKFFTCSGFCTPYCNSDSNWKNDERVMTLNLKQIFMNYDCPEEFEIGLSVHKV